MPAAALTIPPHVRETLRQARERLHETRDQVADRAKVSMARIRDIENGTQFLRGDTTPVRASAAVLARLAAALDLDTAEIRKLLIQVGFDPQTIMTVVADAEAVRPMPPVDLSGLTRMELEQVQTYVDWLRTQRGAEV